MYSQQKMKVAGNGQFARAPHPSPDNPCPWHERRYVSDNFPSSHGFEFHERQQFHEKDNQH
jgi:hypothetical protein